MNDLTRIFVTSAVTCTISLGASYVTIQKDVSVLDNRMSNVEVTVTDRAQYIPRLVRVENSVDNLSEVVYQIPKSLESLNKGIRQLDVTMAGLKPAIDSNSQRYKELYSSQESMRRDIQDIKMSVK